MPKLPRECGQALVEFTLTTLVLVTLMIGVVEMSRLVLIYTAIANAARAGSRYAMVHGSYSSVSPQVQNYANYYLRSATVNLSKVTVTTTYPDPIGSNPSGCTAPGCHVSVSVSYPYYPLSSYFRLRVNLGSISQAVITY